MMSGYSTEEIREPLRLLKASDDQFIHNQRHFTNLESAVRTGTTHNYLQNLRPWEVDVNNSEDRFS
jgi:hypothetical protein